MKNGFSLSLAAVAALSLAGCHHDGWKGHHDADTAKIAATSRRRKRSGKRIMRPRMSMRSPANMPAMRPSPVLANRSPHPSRPAQGDPGLDQRPQFRADFRVRPDSRRQIGRPRVEPGPLHPDDDRQGDQQARHQQRQLSDRLQEGGRRRLEGGRRLHYAGPGARGRSEITPIQLLRA